MCNGGIRNHTFISMANILEDLRYAKNNFYDMNESLLDFPVSRENITYIKILKESQYFVDVTLKSLSREFYYNSYTKRVFKKLMVNHVVGAVSQSNCLKLISQVQKYGTFVHQIHNAIDRLKGGQYDLSLTYLSRQIMSEDDLEKFLQVKNKDLNATKLRLCVNSDTGV